jgi:hypothetical protein
MTQILERAFSEAQKLSDHEQDTLGAIILEEMLDEFRWNEAFAKSQDVLEMLADEAITEFRAGKATPLEF